MRQIDREKYTKIYKQSAEPFVDEFLSFIKLHNQRYELLDAEERNLMQALELASTAKETVLLYMASTGFRAISPSAPVTSKQINISRKQRRSLAKKTMQICWSKFC